MLPGRIQAQAVLQITDDWLSRPVICALIIVMIAADGLVKCMDYAVTITVLCVRHAIAAECVTVIIKSLEKFKYYQLQTAARAACTLSLDY